MYKKITPSNQLKGTVVPPGDKSISHRALIFNSIAEGVAHLTHFPLSADCLATLSCLRALGANIEVCGEGSQDSPAQLDIHGTGGQGLHEADDVLDAGNSATTMRLMAGLLASQPFLSIITGDKSLRSRPMDRIITPLRLMGANIWGRENDHHPPLAIRGGGLRGLDYALPVASAQVKSAIIVAALFASENTTIDEPLPSRDHTERMLTRMGAEIVAEKGRITIHPIATPLKALDMDIPGDISSAAPWLVAGAIHPQAKVKVANSGVNPSRAGIIDALKAMGANIRVENRRAKGNEPMADIYVESSDLKGITIGGEEIPRIIDEIPLLALAATQARGKTVIRDAAELQVKESDRLTNTIAELSKLGAKIEKLEDGMIIHGAEKLRGEECNCYNDHRLAIMLAVAGLIAEGETTVYGAQATDVSYPAFWRDLEELSSR